MDPLRALGRSLKLRQRLGLCALDPILNVTPERFDRVTNRLAGLLDEAKVTLDYEPPFDADEDASNLDGRSVGGWRDRKASWLSAYQADVNRIPRWTRTQEFLMARRYAFLKVRTGLALRRAGIDVASIPPILTGAQEVTNQPAWSKVPMADRRDALARLSELETLRNHNIEGGLYIVLRSVHRYVGLGIDTNDLIQEGNASLFQAIEGFDWTRDVRFKTYAEYWVNQAFLKILYNNVRTVRIPVWVQKALRKINAIRTQAMNERGEELSPDQIGKALGMTGDKVAELLRTNRYAVSIDAELGGEDTSRLSDLLEDVREPLVPDAAQDVSLKDRIDEVMNDLPKREQLILRKRFGLDGEEPHTLAEVGDLLDVSAERVRQLQESALRRLKAPRKLQRLRAFAS